MPASPQPSVRERALTALFDRLRTIAGPVVKRNEAHPQKLPEGGLIILYDGDQGEPEVCLSPLTYSWEHKAELDVLVAGADAADRDLALDALFPRILQAIEDDSTLGGAVEWCAVCAAPTIDTIAAEGAKAWKVAEVAVTLAYTTRTPLG